MMPEVFGTPSPTPRSSIRQFVGLIFLCACCPIVLAGGKPLPSNIICRPELASVHRHHLADKLRQITGWNELHFNEEGVLRIGGEIIGGSQIARELLIAAGQVRDLLVLEDASKRDDVVFARVTLGRWREGADRKPPVHIVLIDFADFSHVRGDKAARSAFDVGWAMLHEVVHVVHNFDDPERLNEPGACEGFVNRMRRECGLAERVEYFHSLLPGLERSEFRTRLVRLAFEQGIAAGNRKKRYWLLWDAAVVGGLNRHHGYANTRLVPRR